MQFFPRETCLDSAIWRFVVQTADFELVFRKTGGQWYFAQFQWETRETPSLICVFLVFLKKNLSWKVFRASLPRNPAATVLRAISLRNTRNAFSKLWILRREWYFAQFRMEIRQMPSSNSRFRVVNRISRNFFEMRGTPAPNCGFHVVSGIPPDFFETNEKRRL